MTEAKEAVNHSFQTLRDGLSRACALMAVVLIGLFSGVIWYDRQHSLHAIDRQLEIGALSLTEYTEATFRAAHLTLESARRLLNIQG